MRTDVSLRRFIGYGAVLVVAAQIAIADYIFFRRILAKYLFPPDRPSGTNPRSLVED